jgi:hypothetical protein
MRNIIEILAGLLFFFNYTYLCGIAFTYLLFNLKIIHLYKKDKNTEKELNTIEDPFIQGLLCFGFPLIWYQCYKNFKKGE